MSNSRIVSLLTLVGLIIPSGNIWGPYLIKVPKGSKAAKFRGKLVLVELIISVVFYAMSLIKMVKAYGDSYDIGGISTALSILVILQISILVVAIVAFFVSPREEQ